MKLQDKFAISAARENLKAFAIAMHPEFMFSWHNRLICQKLMEVEEGKIKHLMINVPPRGGKSMLSSQLFPAWFLGRNPNKHVICATYGQSLADQFGRNVRNMLREREYMAVFPEVNLADDSASIRQFSVTSGGSYYAVGAGGALTGRGASVLILDDTLRNRADANSELIRRNIIDWYKSTAYTRLEPSGSVIILNTRWHEDDLCGYLLKTEPDKWEVINIPAINDNGESYWSERWPVDRLNEIKKSIGSYEWSALYQQNPTPSEGGLFARRFIECVKVLPAKITKKVRYWDRASTSPKNNNDPDYTVGLKLCKDKMGVFYIEDIVRMRGTPLEVQNTILNTATQDGYEVTVAIEQDPGQAGVMEVDYYARLLAGYDIRINRVTNNKVTRAIPVSAQVEAGNVKILKKHWNEEFLSEIEMFPYGKHDDQVDALSGAFHILTEKGLNYNILTKM